MAALPNQDPLAGLTVAEMLELSALPEAEASVWVPTADIREGERLRPVDEVWAGALGDLMLRDGQQTAIDVCRDPENFGGWLLHGAGGHRLRGAQLREIENLKVLVWPHDPNTAKLREIRENLHRRDLDPYDRAAFIAEAVACYKRAHGIDPAKDGRSASVNARWQKAIDDEAEDTKLTLSRVYGWTDTVAEQLGVSRATIKRHLTLYRRIAPDQILRLRDARHPVASNASELNNLAKLEPEEQAKAVDQLLGANRPLVDALGVAPAPKTVGDAVARERGSVKVPASPDERRHTAFLGAWDRMSLTAKKGALHQLAERLPAGFRIVCDDEAGDTDLAVTVASAPEPAVPIRASVKPNYIVCLDCGEKLTNLAFHLRAKHDMASEAYLKRWKLPVDYPMVAPYSEPSAELLAECGGDLRQIAAVIRSWKGEDLKAQRAAIEAGGGVWRHANGTEELKLAKVKATCTAGGVGLISAWLRAADKKLDPEDGGE